MFKTKHCLAQTVGQHEVIFIEFGATLDLASLLCLP